MKLINLATEGVVGEFNYDFTCKVAGGCYAIGETDKNALATALAVALYGAEGDERAVKAPAKSELRFSVGAKEYVVARVFDGDGEQAVLTNGDQSDILAEGSKDVSEAVAYLVEMDKKTFKKLFYIDKAKLTAMLSGTNDERESFIAGEISELTTPDEVETRKVLLRAEESQILARIDGIKPVTRKEIKAAQAQADSGRVVLDTVRKDIVEVTANLTRAEACEDASKEYYEQAAQLEAVSAHKKDIDAKSKALAISKEAAAVKSVFADYLRIQHEVALASDVVASKKKSLNALKKRLSDGKSSEVTIQTEAAYYANRTEEYQKAIREFIHTISSDPGNYQVREHIENKYKEVDAQAEALMMTRKKMAAERDALEEQVAELKAKRLAIRSSAEFKRAIGNGTILEDELKRLGEKIAASNELIKGYDQRITDLTNDINRLTAIIKTITDEQEALDKAIRNGFKTQEDSVNSDTIIKQTLYAKHLIVSANEVELNAVLKKIADVKKAAINYDSKLQAALKRKDELQEHLEKLTVRRQLLTDKIVEYKAHNRFKEMSEDIQYGDRCPICNGFVSVKNDYPVADTPAVEAQRLVIDREISKVKEAINDNNEYIGQITSAKKVSVQYNESLVETADAKRKIITEILQEYGVPTIPALFDLLRGLIEKSKTLTHNLDKYHAGELELIRYSEALKTLVAEKTKLEEETLPAEKKVLEDVTAEYKENMDKYNAIKGFFGKETATALLQKQHVLDAEYEAIENELWVKNDALVYATAEANRIDKEIAVLATRSLKINVDDKNLDYIEVAIKVIADDLAHLVDEADLASDNKDVTATRLVALRKLIAQIESDSLAAEDEIIAEESSLNSAKATAVDIYAGYEAKVKALGVTDVAGLEKLILSEENAIAYAKDVAAYDEEVLRMNERLAKLKEEINLNQPHFDNRDKYNADLKELYSREKSATVELGKSEEDCKDKIFRYDSIVDANKDLTIVQSRLTGIQDCAPAITDGVIIAKDFAALVLVKANGIVANISKDKYRLEMKDDGRVVLYNNLRGRAVQNGKYTREEQKLFEMGIATAYVKTITALLGTEAFGTLSVTEDECNKASLDLISEIAKEYDFILIPDSEAKFTKAIDKI